MKYEKLHNNKKNEDSFYEVLKDYFKDKEDEEKEKL